VKIDRGLGLQSQGVSVGGVGEDITLVNKRSPVAKLEALRKPILKVMKIKKTAVRGKQSHLMDGRNLRKSETNFEMAPAITSVSGIGNALSAVRRLTFYRMKHSFNYREWRRIPARFAGNVGGAGNEVGDRSTTKKQIYVLDVQFFYR
jgi:hypothetical protein